VENVLLTSKFSGVILEKVCEYLYYHETHKDAKDVPDMEIPPELCLELLMAADFLNGEFSHLRFIDGEELMISKFD
jgi:transcription elongation factor B subunit 1